MAKHFISVKELPTSIKILAHHSDGKTVVEMSSEEWIENLSGAAERLGLVKVNLVHELPAQGRRVVNLSDWDWADLIDDFSTPKSETELTAMRSVYDKFFEEVFKDVGV